MIVRDVKPKKVIFIVIISLIIVCIFTVLTVTAFFSEDKNNNIITKEENEDLVLVTEKLYNLAIENNYNNDDVKKWVDSIESDGLWKDLSSDKYNFYEHLERTKQLSLAFVREGELQKNIDLLNDIEHALKYYIDNKEKILYGQDGWYESYFECNNMYAETLLLLKDVFSTEELENYIEYLTDCINDKYEDKDKKIFVDLGEYQVMAAKISIIRACISKDYDAAYNAFLCMSDTLKISNNEGIVRDGLFHQNGVQVYSGGYGVDFIEDIIDYIEIIKETSFYQVFTKEKLDTYNETLLNGYQWLSYRGYMDFGTVGCHISEDNYTTTIGTMVLDRISSLFSTSTYKYATWKQNIFGNGESGVTGNKYFWLSDMMVQRGKNYYISVKVPSKRTVGTETINGMNLKGYNLPLGATNISSSGKEYKNIYAVWDWSRIPGTTAELGKTYKAGECDTGTNELAGGVSNSSNGIIAFSGTYKDISANKAYFMINNVMYCVGSGISGEKESNILTTINQSLYNGDVVINDGKTSKLMQESNTSNSINWVYHDNIGYIIPNKQSLTVQVKEQSGAWKDINNKTGSDTIGKKNIYSIWIDHGKKAQNSSYEYIVVPDISEKNFENYVENQSNELVVNTQNVQAIKNETEGIYAAVFYKAGSVNFAKDYSVTVDKPCLLIIEKSNGKSKVSMASMEHKEETVNLKINKPLSGNEAVTKDGVTEVKFALPGGDLLGSTVLMLFAEGDSVTVDDNKVTSTPIPTNKGNVPSSTENSDRGNGSSTQENNDNTSISKTTTSPEKTTKPLPTSNSSLKPTPDNSVGSIVSTTKPTEKPVVTPTPEPKKVIAASIFEHVNYHGYQVDLEEGEYTLSELEALGMKANDISSIKVTSGYIVYLYPRDNFQCNYFLRNYCLIKTEDDSSFVDDRFNDMTCSIIIEKIE